MSVLGWHFCRNDKRLCFNDGRRIHTGRTIKVDCKPVLCQSGLHASRNLLDALHYAHGNILCRVRLSGEIVHGDDKMVATERTVLWMRSVAPILHEFACRSAERALRRAGVTDERCWNAIKVKRLWLAGKATNTELTAARDTAWDAAWTTAWTTRGAARAAAARTAAWTTARAAAWDAARTTAWTTAGVAERKWQNNLLLKMIRG
jgi:hypothetical protein